MPLHAELSLRGRSGPQRHRLYVESSDPARPCLELRLVGEAYAEADVQPDRLYWGNLRADADAVRTVEVVFHPAAPARVRGVSIEGPGFAAALETREPGRCYRVHVRPVPPMPPGAFERELRLETDHPRFPALTVPMQGRVVGELYAVPDTLWLAATPTHEPVNRLLIVQASRKEAFTLKAVAAPRPDIEVRARRTLSGGYRLEVRHLLPDPALDGRELVITTDHPLQPEVRVPIRIRPTD